MVVMKHTQILTAAILLLAALPAMAQKNKVLPEPTAFINSIEDSDLTVKSDYYTGTFQVRSGEEVYYVEIFSGAPYLCDYITLDNIDNEIINNNIQPVDRRNGEMFSANDLIPMTYDNVVMKSIMQEVFPKCTFGGKSDKFIELWMVIDPESLKVMEVSISFGHSKSDRSMFSIPPYKVRQLECLVKERVIARYRTPLNEQAPARQNASYQVARYFIYISDFDLGISSGPVRDL